MERRQMLRGHGFSMAAQEQAGQACSVPKSGSAARP
jgi:hypothetical protein